MKTTLTHANDSNARDQVALSLNLHLILWRGDQTYHEQSSPVQFMGEFLRCQMCITF